MSEEVMKYLKPGAIVPVDVQTTALLVNALREALAEQPAQPYKGIADHINQATNGRMRIDPVTGDVS